MTTRTLAPGVVVSPLSLGGALLGAADAAEAAAILRVAVASGIALVDTSSAYGASEERIGESPHDSLVVATKFGNPCELNGHTHDYSVGGCAAACFHSLTLLRGKRIAALQLHSPPEQPSPLSSPELRALLESLKASGAIGSWGASVHSVHGGQVALAAGADMLQVPFSVLQQEHGGLLAQCAVMRKGVLVQSALCQGWLTDAGVAAARLLLTNPSHLPDDVNANGRRVELRSLLRAVADVDALARRFGLRISQLALRFAVHTPGCTSALVQARTAAQLRETVGSIDLAPLPAACHEALVALCAVRRADGSVVQGGRSLWSWGAPTPRRCIEAALRVRHVDGGAAGLLSAALGGGGGGTAAAAAAADLRRRFAEDGFVKLERAFPPAVATALVASMKVEVDPTTGAWYPMARRKHLGYRMRSGEYFRCDSSVALPNGVLGGDAPEMASLHGAIEELLDARLFGADDACAGGFLRAASFIEPAERRNDVFETSIVGHAADDAEGRAARAWSAPDGFRPRATCEPIGCMNGWHIDDGHVPHPDFLLSSYLKSPWLIVLVCLTKVERAGGPTVLLRGSHRAMARLLASAPGALNTQRVYSLCAGHDALGGRWPATAAVGEVGDVYLIHPLTLHSATMSCVPRAKSIFNVPFPFLETGVASKQGALSTVVLTIEEARHAARAPTPLLCALYAVTIAAGAAHRRLRQVAAGDATIASRLAALPSAALYVLSGCGFAALDAITRWSERRTGGGKAALAAALAPAAEGGRCGGGVAALWRRARDSVYTLGALQTAWRRRRAGASEGDVEAPLLGGK